MDIVLLLVLAVSSACSAASASHRTRSATRGCAPRKTPEHDVRLIG